MLFRKKVSVKILIPVVLGILLFAGIVGLATQSTVKKGIKLMAQEKAQSDLNTIGEIIEARLPGAWTVQNDILYKGEISLNAYDELVDWLGDLTGNTVTIFLGDTRIATNVLNEGKRAIGTQASEAVIDAVLGQKQEYIGEAIVVGQSYQTAYKPILDIDGKAIGMLYTGASQALIDQVLKEFLLALSGTSFISLILLVLALVFIIRLNVSRPIELTVDNLKKIANLDFEADSHLEKFRTREDEIGQMVQSFEQMQVSLGEVLTSLTTICSNVGSTGESLSASSEENAATVQQVASSTNEFSVQMAEASKEAEQMRQETDLITEKASYGAERMDLTQESMRSIVKASQEVNATMDDLTIQTNNMSNVLRLISEIAEQTNLLALNAAIEAARAGDHGRGFAVVADEVRGLAEQTQRSVQEISQMVELLVNSAELASKIMGTAEQEILEGTNLLTQTQLALDEIRTSINVTASGIKNIADTVMYAEQNSVSIASATEEQAAATQELAVMAGDLSNYSTDLQAIVERFRIG